MAELSLSVLEYEPCLDASVETIRELVEAGAKRLHVDVMREPFIPGKNTFLEAGIGRLYNEFAGKVLFDFHLMINEPYPLFEYINGIIQPVQRGQTTVTVHREAYRDYRENSQGGLGKYASKEHDLLDPDTGDASRDELLKAANVKSSGSVLTMLKVIKACGYKAGLALEPGTSLENVSAEMVASLDLLLLMGVSSGKGGQEYNPDVTYKIRKASEMDKRLIIQVDGGMNDKTIPTVVEAGVTNLVVGSYITEAANPVSMVVGVKELLNGA